jgi:hypothetical protein
LYGFETWSLILREAHRLKVFENGAKANILIEGGWRKLHIEEFLGLFSKI